MDDTTSTSPQILYVSGGTTVAIQASGSQGISSYGSSVGLGATSPSLPLWAIGSNSSASAVQQVLLVDRNPFGAVSNGIGASIDFQISTTSTADYANKIISKWVDATHATRTSQLDITGVNSAATGTIASFYGSGVVGIGISSSYTATRLNVVDNSLGNAYMVNLTTTSTAAGGGNGHRVLNVSASGANASGSQTTYGGYFSNTHSGTSSTTIGVFGIATSGSTNVGVYGQAASGQGVYGVSDNAEALYGLSTSGNALNVESISALAGRFAARPTSTNTVVEIARFGRQVSGGGVGAAGIGGSLGIYLNDDNVLGYETFANDIQSKFTTVTHNAATSTMTLRGVLAGATVDLLTLAGDGSVKLRPITATAASAITPAEGMIVMVSNTNGTFTSIGLWSYQNAAWHAL
jgi:hypothetical protein